jgi:hypothetical protein
MLSRCCLYQRRVAISGREQAVSADPRTIAIVCRPQAAAGGHCSKLGRQIAVDLKADAHFDKCRSCP